MAKIEKAIDQMLSAGMPAFPDLGPRLNTPSIVRYGPKKRAWYRLYEHIGKNGRSYISGAFGYWGLIDATKIETDWSGMDQAERDRALNLQREAENREREKRELRAKNAAQRAKVQWLRANFEGVSAYLQRKQVDPEKGLRFDAEGTLLVPMLRYDRLQGNGKPGLVGLQKIAADGSKRFNKDMAKEGAAFRLGREPKDGDVLLVGEGLSTALSVRKALERQYVAFITFDCGSLGAVARILRKLYPKSPLLFIADDDFEVVCARHKNEGIKVPYDPDAVRPPWCRCNPGRSHAKVAAAEVGQAAVVWPHFVERGENKWTDFNDLHCAEGAESVRKQIEAGFTLVGALLRAGAKSAEKKKKPPPDRGPDFWPRFNKRYTLIYPTVTAWDAEIEQIVLLSAMRARYGDGTVKAWVESWDKRVVNATDVVFDPSCKCDLETSINLFRDTMIKPQAGPTEKLIELLQFLCGEAGQDQAPVTDWVLNWIAYPLKHPGAKMRTAVVMHGGEGTGKNMFWGAVSSIYGEYGGIINQFQLQSQFNDWASRKMFVVANEVVTRMELKHLVGYLKNLVTEPRIPIETKGLPVREEDNHMQLVFLSNEFRPLHIAPGDRRYTIIKTPSERPQDFYATVDAEIKAGGAAALYAYLLERDIGTFNEHTRPPETTAKESLIELGLSSEQLFWRDLHDKLLGMPYGPAEGNDLYRAYMTWCLRNGHKNPSPQVVFSSGFMSMNGVTRKRGMRLPFSEEDWTRAAAEWPQYTVFVMGDRPTEAQGDVHAHEKWVRLHCSEFREAARKYVRTDPWRRSQQTDEEPQHQDPPY